MHSLTWSMSFPVRVSRTGSAVRCAAFLDGCGGGARFFNTHPATSAAIRKPPFRHRRPDIHHTRTKKPLAPPRRRLEAGGLTPPPRRRTAATPLTWCVAAAALQRSRRCHRGDGRGIKGTATGRALTAPALPPPLPTGSPAPPADDRTDSPGALKFPPRHLAAAWLQPSCRRRGGAAPPTRGRPGVRQWRRGNDRAAAAAADAAP